MKITNENAADCTIRIADDMNYGWGAFKKGVAANSKRVLGRGKGEKKKQKCQVHHRKTQIHAIYRVGAHYAFHQ